MKFSASAWLLGLLMAGESLVPHPAAARGGANFMDSPGYQRRLQESRGYVTNQSGSLVTAPAAVAEPRAVKPKRRHHR
ncbi:MAG: hypothetical protein JWQ94_1915 [Tardiphaga sp.]|nr:hypothetical protein [Tardiphaga sp.]